MASFSKFNQFVNTVSNVVNTVSTVKRAFDNIGNGVDFISSARRGNLPIGAEFTDSVRSYGNFSANSQTASSDWRVRIHLPDIPSFSNSDILQPLRNSNKSMVFPTTPVITVSNTANYTSIAPTHSNYPFPAYQSSQVEDITITCEWPVENEADGKYWIASVHFLRSITKMFYGDSPNRGAPPPIVYLSGYGDFVFNRVPVVAKIFTMDLQNNYDYIKVPIGSSTEANEGPEFYRDNSGSSYSYVPTLGRLSLIVSPAYSRDEIRKFNLDEFTKGGYIGSNKGFI